MRVSQVLVMLMMAMPVLAAPSKPAAPAEKGTFSKTLARAPGAAGDWRPVYDRFGRFIVSLPSDWTDYQPDQYGETCNLVASELNGRDGFKTNLIVMQQDAAQGFVLTPAMVQKLADRQLKDNAKYKYRVTDQAYAKVNGAPVAIVGGVLDVDGRKVRNVQMHFVQRGVYYIFTFTSLDKAFAQNEPVFARLARSLVFEREDGTWPTPDATPAPKPSPKPSPAPAVTPSPRVVSSTIALLVVGDLSDQAVSQKEEEVIRLIRQAMVEKGLQKDQVPVLSYHLNIPSEREYCEKVLGISHSDLLFVGLARHKNLEVSKVLVREANVTDSEAVVTDLVRRAVEMIAP